MFIIFVIFIIVGHSGSVLRIHNPPPLGSGPHPCGSLREQSLTVGSDLRPCLFSSGCGKLSGKVSPCLDQTMGLDSQENLPSPSPKLAEGQQPPHLAALRRPKSACFSRAEARPVSEQPACAQLPSACPKHLPQAAASALPATRDQPFRRRWSLRRAFPMDAQLYYIHIHMHSYITYSWIELYQVYI